MLAMLTYLTVTLAYMLRIDYLLYQPIASCFLSAATYNGSIYWRCTAGHHCQMSKLIAYFTINTYISIGCVSVWTLMGYLIVCVIAVVPEKNQ